MGYGVFVDRYVFWRRKKDGFGEIELVVGKVLNMIWLDLFSRSLGFSVRWFL